MGKKSFPVKLSLLLLSCSWLPEGESVNRRVSMEATQEVRLPCKISLLSNTDDFSCYLPQSESHWASTKQRGWCPFHPSGQQSSPLLTFRDKSLRSRLTRPTTSFLDADSSSPHNNPVSVASRAELCDSARSPAEPLFIVIVLCVWLPIVTDWALPVKRPGGTQGVESLDCSTVLNAEL